MPTSTRATTPSKAARSAALQGRFQAVRAATARLAAPLTEADMIAQSMTEASPTAWHLAHTTWFFEELVLVPALKAERLHPEWKTLFNSYYDTISEQHARPMRGLLTRPGVAEILEYRAGVEAAVEKALAENAFDAAALDAIELGLAHEQQHQELLLTDILHLFAQNPLEPAHTQAPPETYAGAAVERHWIGMGSGLVEIGAPDGAFAFDCERPRHNALIHPFALASRCVTNREWFDFIEDGGYAEPTLWMSDGWDLVRRQGWTAPLYWNRDEAEGWTAMTLKGRRPVEGAAPVTHISWYEADAYARWIGARLPTEVEWEAFAATVPLEGNFVDTGRLSPAPAPKSQGAPTQMFGDVWEWTASPFTPYPGYHRPTGPIGEYTGKFMSGQYVLRGGSCATPAGHVGASSRNYFHPDKRWQFSGLRLAKDL